MKVNHKRFLGYMKDEEGQLIIETEEVEAVKWIVRKDLKGGEPRTD